MQVFQYALLQLQRLAPWLAAASPGTTEPQLFLFGGPNPWITSSVNWTAVDDRVRGGTSQSYLIPIPDSTHVRFSGTLDTKTLGGAGFASQTTTGDKVWDLSAYDGLQINIVRGDEKVYTLIVKDQLPDEKRDDGREKSSVNWEYDFRIEGEEMGKEKVVKIWAPWSEFNATYRGREKKDAGPLKTNEIRRFSLMMRSFFDTQEGPFEAEIASLTAIVRNAEIQRQ